MRVIGTAGHVDHGKSALVEALTGTHPDRLKEEQIREMTIDLGFAWLKLPGGEEVGIVDVPGHRDFIENMLAGVGGIDCVLFVVAADEGVMPQTREHLAIIDLLKVPSGILVITKTDKITDPDWLKLVESELRQITAGTVLGDAPIIKVSAREHTGLDELTSRLDEILKQQALRPDLGRPRLPIDRIFSISGFGTVVTGTLIDGVFHVGDEVELQPAGLKARIRGLQSHNRQEDAAHPGSRTAVNLTSLSVDQIQRGNVLTLPGTYQPTRRLDVSFRLLPDATSVLLHNQEVKLFLYASETTARVRLLGVESLKPGDNGWLQLELEQAVCADRGDRFILRRPSPGETLGGGVVIDPHPVGRYKRFSKETLEKFNNASQGSPEELVMSVLHDAGIASFTGLAEKTRLEPARLVEILNTLIQAQRVIRLGDFDKNREEALLATGDNWRRLSQKATGEVARYHVANPLRDGMPREELKSRLKLAAPLFTVTLKHLLDEGILLMDKNMIKIPGHTVSLSDGQRTWLKPLMERFEAAPFAPPPVSECVTAAGDELYRALVETGELVQVSDDVVFRQADYQTMLAFVREHLKTHATLTVAEFRDHFHSSRKYALAFLEHLDAGGVTIREGDFRRLRG
ncbi:MAG: selenocysteine-specific translation elongation factor [Anaerolineaceae bacterium]